MCVCVCIAVPLLYCFYACAVLSPPGVSDKLEWRMDINVHAFKCRWSLSGQITAFNLLHLCVFQLQSLAWLEQKLISLCSFACQTHYKVIFKTQAQIASCMRLDKCTLKKLAMQSTQKIWPVSSTFIIACHVRQLFRNHFPMHRVYKYGIWKICFFFVADSSFTKCSSSCIMMIVVFEGTRTHQTMCTRNLSGNHRL